MYYMLEDLIYKVLKDYKDSDNYYKECMLGLSVHSFYIEVPNNFVQNGVSNIKVSWNEEEKDKVYISFYGDDRGLEYYRLNNHFCNLCNNSCVTNYILIEIYDKISLDDYLYYDWLSFDDLLLYKAQEKPEIHSAEFSDIIESVKDYNNMWDKLVVLQRNKVKLNYAGLDNNEFLIHYSLAKCKGDYLYELKRYICNLLDLLDIDMKLWVSGSILDGDCTKLSKFVEGLEMLYNYEIKHRVNLEVMIFDNHTLKTDDTSIVLNYLNIHKLDLESNFKQVEYIIR